MELILNLIWLVLTATAVLALFRQQRPAARAGYFSFATALLSLACVLVLLFPYVSASDDLHPTQAIVEDSSKRVQQTIAPFAHPQGFSGLAIFFTLAAMATLLAPLTAQPWSPVAATVRILARPTAPSDGRAPPSLSFRVR